MTLAAGQVAFGGTLSFSGTFTQDDNVRLFHYSVQHTGLVDVFTTSFATGGFGTELSLFDASGNFLFSNDGTSSNVDSSLSWNSLAGAQYLIALTEYDNFAVGPTLADGFTEQGNGNFTAMPPFNPVVPGGSFLLPGPIQRTDQWALSFQSNDPTLTAAPVGVPEPASAGLWLAGAVCIAAWKRTRKSNAK